MAIWAAGAIVVGAGISAWSGSKNAKEARKAQAEAAGLLTTELEPVQFQGPGGQFAGTGLADAGPAASGDPSAFNFASLLPGGDQTAAAPQQQQTAVKQDPAGTVQAGGPTGTVGGPTGFTPSFIPGEQIAEGFTSFLGNDITIPGAAAINASSTADAEAANQQQTITTSLGDLEPARAGLVGLATNQIGLAGLGGGLPQNVIQADNFSRQNLLRRPGGDFGALSALEFGAGTQFGNAQADIANARSGFQRGLQGTAFAGAQNLAGIAGQDPQAVAQQRLDLLREQAQPFEARQFQNLQENLFSTGRLGTSGGGLQTEAFARGLGQADLSRQLAASAEGRAFQSSSLQGAQGLAGIGSGVRGLEDNLLNTAFSRFNQTSNLGLDFSSERFDRNLGLQAFQDQRTQQNFQNQIGLSGLGTTLQGQNLDIATQALQAQGGLNDQALNNFQATLAQSTATANAQIGAGSNIAQLASSPNFGQGDTTASTIGAAIANNAGTIGGALGDIFSRDTGTGTAAPAPLPTGGISNPEGFPI